jgi:hypothetical protein
VLTGDNKPLADTDVRLSGDGQTETVASTDAQGRFVFDGVCEGPVTLSADRDGLDEVGPSSIGLSEVNVKAKGGDTNVLIKLGLPKAVPAAVAPGNGQTATNRAAASRDSRP